MTAVYNGYVQSSYINTPQGTLITPDNAKFETGTEPIIMRALFAPTANDAANSVYRIWANVPATYTPLMICLASDALAGTTSVELGLYLPNGGAAVSAGLFCSGVSLATAITTLNPRYAIDGLAAIGLANNAMDLNALLGNVPGVQGSYDVAMTIVTTAQAVGNIALWSMWSNS